MEKRKENAKQDFLEMIRKSWTYAKLNHKEKDLFEKMMDHPSVEDSIIGDYRHRWNACEAAYSMFLAGCGYDHQINWRGPVEED